MRRYSVLVRRLSVGELAEGMCGRCWSRLDRLRRRGGGGGGGMELFVLSLETVRWLGRVEDMDEVRWRSPVGEAGSESSVLRREEVGPWLDAAVRTEAERWGNSVLEELALEVLMSANLAPCLERGGGGGDFAVDNGSLLLGAGLGRGGSIDCCEDMVRDELLRDLLPAVDERS